MSPIGARVRKGIRCRALEFVGGRWLVCAVDVVSAVPMAALARTLGLRQLDPASTAHLKSPPWHSSITSTSA
jgi:hypothetical protein